MRPPNSALACPLLGGCPSSYSSCSCFFEGTPVARPSCSPPTQGSPNHCAINLHAAHQAWSPPHLYSSLLDASHCSETSNAGTTGARRQDTSASRPLPPPCGLTSHCPQGSPCPIPETRGLDQIFFWSPATVYSPGPPASAALGERA